MMDKKFQHQIYESDIYRTWEQSGAFKSISPTKARELKMDPFCVIMPPPNANDPLHIGHAMFLTIEDILIRYQRMKGKAVLWLPGTDHAGIETQYVFEKKLKKQGRSRFNFEREVLYQMIWDYVAENADIAIKQMKVLGASADWETQKFTLEKEVVNEVLDTFEKMWTDGLIYRDLKLVNYCTNCGTAYSDLEVDHEEKKDRFYYVRYELVGGGKPVVIATVRPETIWADVAVAVHPQHKRANELKGKQVINPLSGKRIPIIEDIRVDLKKGTGMLKITPGHDPLDYEIGKTHKLDLIGIIDSSGKMTDEAGSLTGLRVAAARLKAVDELQKSGSMEKIVENYIHQVGVCYRCKNTIEPLSRAQFFVKVKPLTTKVKQVLDKGQTKIFGAGHDKILNHWLDNLADWNISRQIVWGIRMPIWYQITNNDQVINSEIEVGFINQEQKFVKDKVGELLKIYEWGEIETGLQTLTAPLNVEGRFSRNKPEDGNKWLQETDTFDTWYSSSQWPVITLKTLGEEYLKYYYPTAVMDTGYDILMFWVMRMMMMGLYLTKKTPFKNVYLHGLVRDEQGQKMSKSKGNVINPLELVEKYGADALRMALVISTKAGLDSAVGEGKVRGMRNLANKIWNATRYVKLVLADKKELVEGRDDGEFYQKLEAVVIKTTNELDKLKVGQAAETVHNEFWHWFCDVEIEAAKNGLLSPTALAYGLEVFLKLLHPFMPFVTEVCFGEMGFNKEKLLIAVEWPRR